VSSLRRGHANLLCIVPILTDDPFGSQYFMFRNYIYTVNWIKIFLLWVRICYNSSKLFPLFKIYYFAHNTLISLVSYLTFFALKIAMASKGLALFLNRALEYSPFSYNWVIILDKKNIKGCCFFWFKSDQDLLIDEQRRFFSPHQAMKSSNWPFLFNCGIKMSWIFE